MWPGLVNDTASMVFLTLAAAKETYLDQPKTLACLAITDVTLNWGLDSNSCDTGNEIQLGFVPHPKSKRKKKISHGMCVRTSVLSVLEYYVQ